MKFSVIIATWNESAQIYSALRRLRQISQPYSTEIIVVDGASTDNTVELARQWADQTLSMPSANRGAQLDAGARKATGDILFFLRADSQPPSQWQQSLEHFWLSGHSRKASGTGFSVDYGSGLSYRLASRMANWRAWQGLISADHGLCTTPEIYRDSGGFPAVAYGEDMAFSRRLAKLGRLVLLKDMIWPAARRMRQLGPTRFLAERAWLSLRSKLGASPDDLWRVSSGL
ncbi:MAG: glycosyltransferase [Elusimicrobia bacterium]|nr:glycosyltransferase [Elusimicrobiota bacterium]